MKKRTWHYIQNPSNYCITCNLCQGSNIEWSEFDHRIWCYDCKKDVKGTMGIFDGPIPLQGAQVMGICFDVYDMNKKKIVKFNTPEWDLVTMGKVKDKANVR